MGAVYLSSKGEEESREMSDPDKEKVIDVDSDKEVEKVSNL